MLVELLHRGGHYKPIAWNNFRSCIIPSSYVRNSFSIHMVLIAIRTQRSSNKSLRQRDQERAFREINVVHTRCKSRSNQVRMSKMLKRTNTLAHYYHIKYYHSTSGHARSRLPQHQQRAVAVGERRWADKPITTVSGNTHSRLILFLPPCSAKNIMLPMVMDSQAPQARSPRRKTETCGGSNPIN